MKHLISMNRSNINRKRLNALKKPRGAFVLSERDFAAIRLKSPTTPPQYNTNPVVQRVVRLILPYTGSTLAYNCSASTIVAQDGSNYLGASTPRYTQVRYQKLDAWLALDTPGATPTSLDIHDAYSNMDFTDVLMPGVNFARVSYRPPLSCRMTYLAASSTSQFFGVNVPASTGATGSVILDVTVSFD